MSIDSRKKGRTGEMQARDQLRKLTNYKWERIPSSGALKAEHGLKGDLYIPQVDNLFCVEVKWYKDDQINSKILTSKNSIFFTWWEQTLRQSKQVNKVPLLLFKYDRSKWFCAFDRKRVHVDMSEFDKLITLTSVVDDELNKINICLLKDFCEAFKNDWVRR
jgi:hypothetical protein